MTKRLFDVFFAIIGLLLVSWVLFVCFLIASIDTQSVGLFWHFRVGQFGKTFKIFKIKTMNDAHQKITVFGQFLRKSKLDELPQLFNILLGQMSFVGPRPDVVGYADMLSKKDNSLLSVKPGLTGLASLKYRSEEQLLATQSNPQQYNDTVIWPDKVRINNWYVQNHTLWLDFKIMIYTIMPIPFDVEQFILKYQNKSR